MKRKLWAPRAGGDGALLGTSSGHLSVPRSALLQDDSDSRHHRKKNLEHTDAR